jgi:hypothetical protein
VLPADVGAATHVEGNVHQGRFAAAMKAMSNLVSVLMRPNHVQKLSVVLDLRQHKSRQELGRSVLV